MFGVISGLFPTATPPNIIQLTKDGQLGWVGAGFSGSTLYELMQPGAGKVMSLDAGAGYVMTAAIAFLGFSSFLAAGGAIFPVVYPMPAGNKWSKHFQLLVKSTLLTILSAVLYGLVHYGIVGVGPAPK